MITLCVNFFTTIRAHMSALNLCQYRDALGVPKQGFHSARLGPFARNDLLATAGAALFLNIFVAFGANPISWSISLIVLFLSIWLLGVVLHVVFCVPTPITEKFFAKRVNA